MPSKYIRARLLGVPVVVPTPYYCCLAGGAIVPFSAGLLGGSMFTISV